MHKEPTHKPGQLTRLYYMRQLMRVAGVASQFQETGDADTVTKGDREMSVCEMQAALARADTGVQRARFDSVEAQWLKDSIAATAAQPTYPGARPQPRAKPPAGPHPRAPRLGTPFGIGGA